MENNGSPERSPPVQLVRGSRAFRQFKNPPQPHMCIQDTIKDSTEKLYINVLGWQKIANPKQFSDPIPLYGGMQVPQGCGLKSNRPPLLVFAVMVNPDILKANGKNAPNPADRDALVNLLCDFVEAMNPGLVLARKPVILKERDLAGELKDVWLAVQNKREREKNNTMYKVYDIDGICADEVNDDDKLLQDNDTKHYAKAAKKNLNYDHYKSDFGQTNGQIQDNMASETPYRLAGNQLVNGESQSQIDDHKTIETDKPSTSFRKEWNTVHGKTTEGWDEFSKRNLSAVSDGQKATVNQNGKAAYYDFFPMFDKNTDKQIDVSSPLNSNATGTGDSSNLILESMQNLVLHATDNKLCDSNTSALKSVSS